MQPAPSELSQSDGEVARTYASLRKGHGLESCVGPVPYSGTQLAAISNLVSSAFRVGPTNSVHQILMLQPLGCNVPDVELQTATIRIQLGLRMFKLHARDMEGQTLRWCLRAIQESRQQPDFTWSSLRTPCQVRAPFFWESTFTDQNNPKRQTAGPCGAHQNWT